MIHVADDNDDAPLPGSFAARYVHLKEVPLSRSHMGEREQWAMAMLDRVKAGEKISTTLVNEALRITGDLLGMR